MPKPNGIKIGLGANGPVMRTTQHTRWEDKLYDSVQEAILSGVEPKQFTRAVREAWQYELTEERRRKLDELERSL